MAPEVSTKFVTFETVKRSFADSDADLESWQRAVAGGSAGVTAHVTWFPLEGAQQRRKVGMRVFARLKWVQ